MTLIIREDRCQNTPDALRCEWLDTNGAGGYASSTILNCHTRKYHGLLVANLAQPAGRHVLLSKFEDSLAAEGKEFFLSCHKYPGVFFPRGHQYLSAFRHDLYPVFTYRIGDALVRKSTLMLHGRNAVMLRYRLERCATPVTLRLKPLLAFRGFHALARENIFLQVRTYGWEIPNGCKITPYPGLPDLFIQTSDAGEFLPTPQWYRNFEYPVESERGYEAHEDLFNPGLFELPLRPGRDIYVVAATDITREPPARLWQREETRRKQVAARCAALVARPTPPALRSFRRRLLTAARDFTVAPPGGVPAIIAGYPWFDAWGRDTLIALPGLTFCAGQPEKGRAILEAFTRYERRGLLPNMIDPGGVNHSYNAADTSLWFFWAVQQMLLYTGDLTAVRARLWPTMKTILRHLMAGTDDAIFMNAAGLLHAGSPGSQLTWMDAAVRGTPVTPRHGYAVDINALWYNAVCFADQLATQFQDADFRCGELREQIRAAFSAAFWLAKEEYLGDVVGDNGLDPAVRPNQILAVSLPNSPLDADQAAGVFERVRRELLTPCGLRTLSPRHADYRGRYEGNAETRDRAYHQGTVWPWLSGHLGEACLKVTTDKRAARHFVLTQILQPLAERHLEYGLGHIPEIFDGDPPHRPQGCIAQAWSTGEILRLCKLLDGPAVSGLHAPAGRPTLDGRPAPRPAKPATSARRRQR
jgi:predicted glycogen debranching enzyme